ncbi:glycosyltransferase family 4 protein [Chryseobacterium sp. PBS4-4]|uniref:Glycosyltransferase family 4 protein n=1 Tax=Chryseobacterium edaphi TaxID=2976532 RepID=A0ABT2W8Z0_9FLAO|nr:glycosyltransferase family 1 protein [Chryseobacterium edaphi]MCU7618681.1 glycosyltransferase family 4 protein [Chryseobacterium edaphi]
MRIGFDAFPLQVRPSGIGKYVINVLEEILKNIPDAELYAYSNQKIGLSEKLVLKIHRREFYDHFQHKMPGKVWLKFLAGKYIKKDNIDVFISTTGFFPSLEDRVRKIAIVHDLNAKLVPKTMGKMHYLTHLLYFRKDILSADFIISNSIGTSDKLFYYFKKESDEIINPPVSDNYKLRSSAEINQLLQKYDIKNDYILFVGNLEPRKNLVFVLKNFIELVEQKKINNVKLIIVGMKGWKDSEIQNFINKHSDSINALGYVSETDLPLLYAGAKVFVFPSIYEGFGIPVREALLSGTPVITSDIVELKEAGDIAGDTDMVSYINPYNAEDFKNNVLKYLNNIILKKEIKNPQIMMPKLINFIKRF